MPKILNLMFKALLTGLFFSGTMCYGQYTVKHTVNNNLKTAETTEYYIYNRKPDSYNALSVKAATFNKTGTKTTYQLNINYTSTSASPVQKLKFTTLTDSLTTFLIADGIKPVDNKSINTMMYHIIVTDSAKTFLIHHTLKSLIVLDNQDRALSSFEVDPNFLSQQFACLQAPAKHKPQIKKQHKKST